METSKETKWKAAQLMTILTELSRSLIELDIMKQNRLAADSVAQMEYVRAVERKDKAETEAREKEVL